MESLALWLAVSAPLTIVLSLVGGYLLAGRALLPVRELGNQVAALDVEGLSKRLPLSANPDELDKLASQFNGLLDRLSTARDANRRFLRQAAHQIRTPLTLVLGEATLSLERHRSPGDQVSTLNRIRLAAEQMRRRVDELFLLAQARSGERVSLDQDIELDGLALETTDLMRSRLTDAGQRLELVDMLPVVARGHEGMLREALIELLENACRHGSRESPIQVSVTREGAHGVFSVASAGPPFAPGGDAFAPNAPNEGHGIGLQVVRWIADQHGGRVQIQRVADTNVVRVYVRLVPLGSNSSTSVAL
jgi:two-component system OmpR family sensor kinase